MVIFQFFQYGGCPPSWICYVRAWNAHEAHLVVCITVQNLVGIDVVVSIICVVFYFASWFENAFHAPKLGFLGKPMHRLQIRLIVHNWEAPPTIPPSYIRAV